MLILLLLYTIIPCNGDIAQDCPCICYGSGPCCPSPSVCEWDSTYTGRFLCNMHNDCDYSGLCDAKYVKDENICTYYHFCVDCDIGIIGYYKCKDYKSLEPSLSEKGVKWSKSVRRCIQEKISNSNKYDCAKLQDIFFYNHISCYLDGDISFCELPLSDQGKIIYRGSDMIFSKHGIDIYKTGDKLFLKCHKYFYIIFITILNHVKRSDSLSSYREVMSINNEIYIKSDSLVNINEMINSYDGSIFVKDMITGICSSGKNVKFSNDTQSTIDNACSNTVITNLQLITHVAIQL